MRIRMSVLSVAVVASLVGGAGAEDRRAVVMTNKGDAVEGVFRGATELEATIEVAGQPLKIPASNIKYISFAGKLDAPPAAAPAGAAAGSQEDAFAALDEIQAALEVGGLLRPQYADLLQRTLPRVAAYLKTDPAITTDAQVSLLLAINSYQEALDMSVWPHVGDHVRRGRQYGEFARELIASDPPDHREDPAERRIAIGDSVEGRFGEGDQELPEELGKGSFGKPAQSTGALRDVYVLEVTQSADLQFDVVGGPGDVGIAIQEPSGKRLAHANNETVLSLKKGFKPGTYKVWVGASAAGPGRYTLRVSKAD